MPIVPMILINDTDGIGTGWATKIPNYDPRQVVANLQRLLRGEEPRVMIPWFKNFRGTIASLGHQKFVCNGEIASLSANKLEITDHNTDQTIRMIVQMDPSSTPSASTTTTSAGPT